MKTHTIRNKSKTTPIITLTKEFLDKLLETDMDTVSIVLNKYNSDYFRLTGKQPSLDYEQQLILYQKLLNKSDSSKSWTSKYSSLEKTPYQIYNIFVDGLLNSPLKQMDDTLTLVTEFLNLLNNAYLIKNDNALENKI